MRKGEMMGNEENEVPERPPTVFGVQYQTVIVAILALLVIVTAYNQFQIMTLISLPLSGTAVVPAATVSAQASSGQQVTASLAPVNMIPTGTPDIYGTELGIKYDDISASNPNVQDAINKLAQFDEQGSPTYITLSGGDLNRYVKIGSAIACEYCCGAATLVDGSGNPACGCAHSYAMRGLLKYLIRNHGSQYTDDQLLEELGKWKTLFFPGPMDAKAAVLKAQGITLNYENLGSNQYRGIESSSSSGAGAASGGSAAGGSASQVGGC